MAGELKGLTISLVAANAVTIADKFKPVYITGEKTFSIATAGTEKVVGVVQTECKAGEAAQILTSGITFYTCTATTAAGAEVGTWGVALNAGVTGDVISVLIL